ncbi:hypothetical protein KSF_063200 [Reticulibacter mediterranei]|uniref:Uncharacterized protein n=1 Tax=Reticulibacter mediterranei TaxID=2778369 RepID=A0A8J3N6M7_9CHLR|nr:hypothetical protein [Reticulibacter mediterranei]GHO96272.1 hypothetical protein KSF_063200 [Reticulibacter mediterranei]
MPSPLDDEIRGDWNNLKGTEYHLIYVLWLLLCRNVRSVAFYRGNDLLANLTTPPAPEETSILMPAVRVQDPEEDEWIQLKATRDPWTATALLDENLLLNFILNALSSETGGRAWRTRLVTQGEVRKEAIERFADDPETHSELNSKLKVILDNAQKRLQQEGWQQVDQPRLQLIALNILGQLAQEEPLSLRQLKAEVDLQLAYRYLVPKVVQQAGNNLLGALLRDSAGGPTVARIYDNAWLDEVAGMPLKPLLPFDSDPASACDQAVQAVYDSPGFQWEARRCAPRTRVTNELQYFLQAPEIVFVMLGMSGIGKSWIIADWTGRVLLGRARLLIPGSDLDHVDQRILSRLIAQHLRIFTSAPISDEDLLAKLRAFARLEGKGPLVLVIDDLQPTGDISVFRRDLGKMVEQCRDAGIKLILTAQTHIWEFYRLGQKILSSDIYQMDPEVPQEGEEGKIRVQLQSPCSLILPDFTTEEQEIALLQRLTPEEGRCLSHFFRSPAFAPLRRPYLLERYLEQYRENPRQQEGAPAPVNIDALLDSRLEALLLHVATLLNVDEHDVADAFHTLHQQIWMARPNGLSNADAIAQLELFLRNRSNQALDALRQVGILTTRGRIRFADTPLAERVFARTLSENYLAGNDDVKDNIIQQLRPEEDAGVVSALLRSLAHANPVSPAEALLRRDPLWVVPVAEGLAQCSSQDYRVLAFLTTLTRREEDAFGVVSCAALGQLAAQKATQKKGIMCMQRAFKWVAQLYVSERRKNRLNGSHALGFTLDFAPEHVEAVMRFCVSQISHLVHVDKEQRDERLHDAFMPLLSINHTTAAEVGKRLLSRYSFLLTNVAHLPSRRSLREIDEVRGRIALFEHGELESILSDLHSQEVNTRGRAATALRSIMFEQPERILDEVCDAIRNESDQHVTNQLLWATYRLLEIAPDKLLDALIGSPALDWSIPSLSTGSVLACLSNLAQLLPTRVAPLLPERLKPYDARLRAWLSEGLAFTWWTCAQYSSQAQEQLTHLAVPDIADVPTDYRLFAFRGAIIAQLGLTCLGLASPKELQGLQTPYPETEMQFFFVNTTSFVRNHASTLLRQSSADHLLNLLLRCLIEESQTLVHPLQKTLFRAHNVCTHLCMEMLIWLAAAHSDPISLLRRLPRNWRLVYAMRRLLDAGRREASILSFARELCNVSVVGSDVQELGEREQLLAQLVSLSEAPAIALQELQASLPASPFTADHRAEAFTRLAEANLENMLDLLSQSLESEDNLAALYQWSQKARSWQGLLIARVYERMFDERPIRRIEAYELCEQMLTAIHALPRSELQQQYILVYSMIAQWLKEKLPLKPEISPLSTGDAMISRSHIFALELLQQNFPQSIGEQELENRLLDMLATGYNRGWREKTGVALKEETVSIGTSHDLAYVFPAVRLALIAIKAVTNTGLARDLAAQFLEQRASVRAIIAEHHWHLDTNDQEILQATLAAFEQVGYMARRDERVRLNRGYLLIKLDRLTEAEEELNQCLTMPSCKGLTQASAFYDLACIYALTNREELCRTTLPRAIKIWPQFREEMAKDPDFVTVCDSPWFQALHNDGI